MEVIKAAVMGIAAAMLALYMKSVRPEYSSMISISAGIFIFGFALICLQKITGSIQPGLYKNSSADHRHCLYL